MADVSVVRMRARYRVPPRDGEAPRRLDAVLRRAVGEPLERSVEAAGVPADALVCVRRLRVPVRLDLERTDVDLARAWSNAVAEALQGAVASGGAVIYRGPAAALADLAEGALSGDGRRTWAWRALGLWAGGSSVAPEAAAGYVADALAAEPGLLPAQLASLARLRAPFVRLVGDLPAARWRGLARAAALALGGRPAAVDRFLDGPVEPAPDARPRSTPTSPGAGHRPWRGGPAASRIAGAAGERAPLSPVEARALALLALLEVEPAALRAVHAVPDDVAGLAARLAGGGGVFAAASRREQRASTGEGAGAGAGTEPAEASRRGNDLLRPIRGPRPDIDADRDTEAAVAADAGAGGDPSEPAAADGLRRPEPDGSPEPGAAAVTSHGGLLFLLHLVEGLGLPDRLPRTPGLEGRGLRWCLHALALRLAPVAPDDPAALAFCGLGPDAEPPTPTDPEASRQTDRAVEEAADEVRRGLAARLDREPGRPPPSLDDVVARRAELSADPGWIEARFDLRDVSLDVRRAGLDLDPDWLPWLGIVMRFRYA